MNTLERPQTALWSRRELVPVLAADTDGGPNGESELAITAPAVGGELDVSSELGSSAKFSAWRAPVATRFPSDPGDEKVNILIVDDTPENLVAVEALLADLNQNIVKASSGHEALRHILRQDFAVILLDVNMPVLNGYETAALIRQRPSSEHTPIIFLSAISTSDMHAARGYALGAVDFLFTPVVPEILKTKVSVFVELLRKRHETRRQAEMLREMEEREHRRKLREAAEQLETETRRNRFFRLTVDMLAIAGFNGHFVQVNPSWQQVLGFDPPEFLRRPLLDFIKPEDRAMTAWELEQIKTSRAPVRFENRCAARDGTVRWLAWTGLALPEERLIYLSVRDVTAYKQAEQQIFRLNETLALRAQELERANAELHREVAVRKQAEEALRDSNAELESFSYSVSHDLRAPLRAMHGFAEALLEDYSSVLDNTGKDFARRIVGAAGRMDHLIRDLLAYSRVGRAEIELRTVDIADVLCRALRQIEEVARESRAVVETEAPLLPVIAHAGTFEQVLCNLISNAIKFVEPGQTPRVRLRTELVEDRVRLWVEDNGIGIDPAQHAKIFRVFERLHGMEKYPGTGVGLAIVRKGVERMGGQVGLESELGKGSRFWIELPLGGPVDRSAVERTDAIREA